MLRTYTSSPPLCLYGSSGTVLLYCHQKLTAWQRGQWIMDRKGCGRKRSWLNLRSVSEFLVRRPTEKILTTIARISADIWTLNLLLTKWEWTAPFWIKIINFLGAQRTANCSRPNGEAQNMKCNPFIGHFYARRSSKQHLGIQSVPQRKHNTAPLQRSTG
jgi:hypothetical protein